MSHAPQTNREMSPATRRGIIAWIAWGTAGLAGFAALIFLAAGRMDWLWGWVYVAVTGLGLAAHPLLLIPINPSLLAERSRGIRAAGTKIWDRWLVLTASGLLFASMAAAAFEVRANGPHHSPLALNLAGLALSILGWVMFMWAMASNAYFAEGVRIQSERGHTVCTEGPYRFVRHPGYVGSILIVLGTPALLGSLVGLALAGAAALIFILRTALEDRTLRAELPGYAEYAQQTRYRLVPGIW